MSDFRGVAHLSRTNLEVSSKLRLANSHHFTPLRYPGGKGKLASFVKKIIQANKLDDGEYVEPYAGGAAVALELLFLEHVSHIHINDISKPIFSFWTSVLNSTDELCRLIVDTPRTVEIWDKQKAVLKAGTQSSELETGFALFFLNRTNRSGILNAGIIGGRDQTGPWKIDARYNADELVRRIQSVARMSSRISLTNHDAVEFLREGSKKWPRKTLIYCDPPYYVKGRELYFDFYRHEDHCEIAQLVTSEISEQSWIVSYDNVEAIREMYAGNQFITYQIGYSARSSRSGSEIMFFDPNLIVPEISGPLSETDRVQSLPPVHA